MGGELSKWNIEKVQVAICQELQRMEGAVGEHHMQHYSLGEALVGKTGTVSCL